LLTPRIKNPVWRRAAIAVILAAIVGAPFVGGARMFTKHSQPSETAGLARSEHTCYAPNAAGWASLSVVTVSERVFRAERITEGKIAVNEDGSTTIFSPYAGRVTKLLVKPSDTVERDQPLFIIEAADTVQGLNDFVSALSALNTARSKLNLALIVEKRAGDLCAGKAVPLKDWQQAQSDLTAAPNDMRSVEIALDAAHNRLRILGRSEEQISTF
jgi:membrane fusion protein, heavy metal efflux system